MAPTPRVGRWLVLALLAALGAVALLWPTLDLIWPDRILFWHIKQTGFVHGGPELLGVAVLIGLALAMRRAWSPWLAAALIAAYLRRHHVDLPALAAILHLELLLAMGVVLLRCAGRTGGSSFVASLRPLLAGVTVWIVLAVLVSLAGFGRPADLKLLALALLPVALPLAGTRPLLLRGWLALRRRQGFDLAIAVAIVAVLIGWLARSNNVEGHDALWYGFRPDRVLAPERSFFDDTGLVAPVYYFPKLFELLIAPLSAFRDYSFPLAFGAGLLGLFGVAIWRLLVGFGIPRRLALLGALTTLTIPAIGNSALSPKPDLIAGLLLMLALLWAWRAVRCRQLGDLLWMLAAMALASACKLTSPPYAVGLLLGTALALRFWPRQRRWQHALAADWCVLALALLATAAMHARTWWLTGLPTIAPEALVGIWQWLGFRFVEPVGTLQWLAKPALAELPRLSYDMLLAPSSLKHLIVSWTGNVWLWLMIAGGLLRIAAPIRPLPRLPATAIALMTPVLIVGLVLAVGVSHKFRGGDGNYLIVPVACAILAGLLFAQRSSWRQPFAYALIVAMLVACSAMQYSYSFVNSHWGDPGTRRLDLDFGRSSFDSKNLRDRELRRAGLDDIATALADRPAGYRVIGLLDADAQGHRLPVRYEDLSHISYSRPEYLRDVAGFRRLLRTACVDAVILPVEASEDRGRAALAQGIRAALQASGATSAFRGRRHELIQLPADDSDCLPSRQRR